MENDDYAVDLQETLLLVGAKTLLYPADLTQKTICKRMLNDVHLPKNSYPFPLAHWQILKTEMSDQCDLHNEEGEHGDLNCETVVLHTKVRGFDDMFEVSIVAKSSSVTFSCDCAKDLGKLQANPGVSTLSGNLVRIFFIGNLWDIYGNLMKIQRKSLPCSQRFKDGVWVGILW